MSVRICQIAVLLLLGVTTLRAEVERLDVDAMAALRDQGALVIDVRTESEWRDTGMVPGSVGLTFFDEAGRYDVAAFLAALDGVVGRDDPLVLICAAGVRSARVATLLDERLGFSRVHDATGGIRAWIGSGRPVEPYAAPSGADDAH